MIKLYGDMQSPLNVKVKEKPFLIQPKIRLEEAEELHRAVLASLKDYIAVLDSNGWVITVNEAWNNWAYENGGASLGGVSVGANYLEFMRLAADESDEVSRASLAGIQSVFSGELECFELECPCLTPSALRWFLMTATPLRSPSGGCVVCYTDITDRKRAQEELKSALAEIKLIKDRLPAQDVYPKEEIKLNHNFGEIIGQSAALKNALYLIERVASTDATVLILGETGTGKELFARAIHDLSARKEAPFIKVDCGSIPAGLIESELFGHEKGAFTGAVKQRLGRFELANRGTIFLDEVGDLPLDLQTKLLRVLQEAVVERLGDTRAVRVNVRVVAATNRDINQRIKDGEFREDLYYRLSTFPVHLPPLRDRREDIPLLTRHFVQKYNYRLGKRIEQIPQKFTEALQNHHFPGNVRELENIIARAVILSNGPTLHVDELLSALPESGPKKDEPQTIESVERVHILRTLIATNWRIEGRLGAAQRLGINPSTLRSRMKKLGINKLH